MEKRRGIGWTAASAALAAAILAAPASSRAESGQGAFDPASVFKPRLIFDKKLAERMSATDGRGDLADAACFGKDWGATCSSPRSASSYGGPGFCDARRGKGAQEAVLACSPYGARLHEDETAKRIGGAWWAKPEDLAWMRVRHPNDAEGLEKAGIGGNPLRPPPIEEGSCAGKPEGAACQVPGEGAADVSGTCFRRDEATFRAFVIVRRAILLCRPDQAERKDGVLSRQPQTPMGRFRSAMSSLFSSEEEGAR